MTYRGLALFGDPGIGKSTVANFLHKFAPQSIVYEGADVLYRIAALDDIPTDKADLVRLILSSNGRRKPSRDGARSFFQQLTGTFGDDIIAVIMIAAHREDARPMIASGARGLANARRFKLTGYRVVYLRAPEAFSASRLTERDGTPPGKAINEVRIERKLFHNIEIEAMADVVVDANLSTSEEIARQLVPLLRA